MRKAAEADSEKALAREKCMMLFAQTAVKRHKSLLSRRKADQYTAEIATRSIRSTDYSLIWTITTQICFYFLFFFFNVLIEEIRLRRVKSLAFLHPRSM